MEKKYIYIKWHIPKGNMIVDKLLVINETKNFYTCKYRDEKIKFNKNTKMEIGRILSRGYKKQLIENDEYIKMCNKIRAENIKLIDDEIDLTKINLLNLKEKKSRLLNLINMTIL